MRPATDDMRPDEQQLSDDQHRRVSDAIESVAWGDIDGEIRSLEDAMRRAVEATRADADRWDAELEGRYVDEFSVDPSDVEDMDPAVRLAYVGRLVRSLALVWGVSGGYLGREAVGEASPGSLGHMVRTLNDITWLP
jgi:hypothetical protein